MVLLKTPALQKRKEFGRNAGGVAGSFLPFLFPFWYFEFGKAVFGRKVIRVILPKAGKKVIKSTDTRSISKRETT